MKKNLLTIVILALVVVNLAMTGILMFTMMPASQKVNTLITQIATAIDLDINTPQGNASVVPIEDVATYTFEDTMTITLKPGEDGQTHMAVLGVTLSMNTKDDDYSTYGASIADNEDLIKAEINTVVSGHTYEDMMDDSASVQDEILEDLQSMYGSTFIVGVKFSSVVCQ
jgi:flagellar FliL protein